MRLPIPSSRSACACVIGATLLFPMAAAGEEIRVLFVPSQDLATEVQTRALVRAITELSNSVRAGRDLADAHVLIQLTDYRVEHRKEHGPWRWWEGRVKMLLPPMGRSKTWHRPSAYLSDSLWLSWARAAVPRWSGRSQHSRISFARRWAVTPPRTVARRSKGDAAERPDAADGASSAALVTEAWTRRSVLAIRRAPAPLLIRVLS